MKTALGSIFLAKRSKDFPEYLIVYCGHEDCTSDRPFLVHASTWLRPLRRQRRDRAGQQVTYVISGRSCPYCFRAGRVPRRSEIG